MISSEFTDDSTFLNPIFTLYCNVEILIKLKLEPSANNAIRQLSRVWLLYTVIACYIEVQLSRPQYITDFSKYAMQFNNK